MVLLLARALDVPLRDRNDLLSAAGYAPVYRATDLEAPTLAQARRALDFVLRQQEPYPAIVIDRHWDILQANGGTARLVELFLEPSATAELGLNAMRLMFHPRGFRPHIVNWEAMAAALIQWLHRDVLSGLGDAGTRRLLDELLAYPGVPSHWRRLDLDASTDPFLPIEFRRGEIELRYFSMLTSLGTPARHHAAGAPDRIVLPRRRGHRGRRPPPRVRADGCPAPRAARDPERPVRRASGPGSRRRRGAPTPWRPARPGAP